MINKLNELDLDIKRCEIVLKENNYLDIVIAIEEIHDKYKNTIDSISNISRDVVWNYSKKDIENIQNYLKDYKDELILKEKQKNIYDKFIDLKEYIEDKDILEKQKLVEAINLIENINNDDLNILKDMDIAIVHNPVSNMRLGCKIADITKYLKNNINVCLGTDGQGSGSNLDMFEAMRVACLIQGGIHENEERINAKDVIKMATINGAKALQKEDEIGSIEEGKDADIILVNIEESLDNITMVPNLNKIANLVYNTSGKNVDTTIVKGEILMENRNIKNIDVKEIINKCNDIIKRLF